jgi:hypothetical protein
MNEIKYKYDSHDAMSSPKEYIKKHNIRCEYDSSFKRFELFLEDYYVWIYPETKTFMIMAYGD